MLLNSGSLGFPPGGKTMFSGGGPPNSGTPNDTQMYDPMPINQLNQILANTSIPCRCLDLQTFIIRTPVEDLKKIYPLIVNHIFGFGSHLGWGLRALTRRDSPREMDATQRLLGPEGSIIQLAYRLMTHDPLLRYEFPLQCLPVSIERNISQNDVPAYFPKNIRLKFAALNIPYALFLNPFEYFIYVFTSVLVGNRAEQNTYLFGWQNLTESVYTNLLEDFLLYFLPTNGRAVPPIPQEEPQPRTGINCGSSHLVPRPPGPKVPKIFRSSILDDESYVIANRNISLSHEYSPMERENWRSEALVNCFIIMWMHIDSTEGTLSSQFETILPNIEMVKSVRMIVRHFHFFNNVVDASVMHPLEDIKKFLFPLFQRRLYVFLRYLFQHWPMDHSFRIVYETWLSYLQPWRYVSQEIGVVRDREEVQIDQRWNVFITDNVLFYTYLLQTMLIRIAKSDLTTYRNAHMLFRITKIFTSQKLIKPTLKSLDASLAQLNKSPPFTNAPTLSSLKKRGNAKINLNTSAFTSRRVSFNENSFSAANSSTDSYIGQISPSPHAVSSVKFGKLGTTFKDLEDNKVGYVPLFSPVHRDLVRDIMKSMQKAKDVCTHYISDPVAPNRPAQTLKWLKSLFSSTENSAYIQGPTPNTISEKEKVIYFLDSSRGALADLFDIMMPEEMNGIHDLSPGMSPIPNGFDSLEGSSGLSSLDVPEVKTIYRGYHGHPDLAPYRADENARAVQLLNTISELLNAMFGPYIRDNYLKNTPAGKITRAIVAKPQFYDELRKRGPGDSSRVKKCLAPRIVLRPLGSTAATLNLLGFMLIGFLFGLEGYGWFFVPLLLYVFYILIRTYFEPADNLANLKQEFEGLF